MRMSITVICESGDFMEERDPPQNLLAITRPATVSSSLGLSC